MKQKTKPALRVVAENPHRNLPRDPTPKDKLPFILPPVHVPSKVILYDWVGMTKRQANLAFQRALATDDRATISALDDVSKAKRMLEAALETYRRVMLAALLQRYPAAARRIMNASPKADPGLLTPFSFGTASAGRDWPARRIPS